MPLNPLRFETPEAYSSFDFSPLAKLGQLLRGQQQPQLANLSQGTADPLQPNPAGTVASGPLPSASPAGAQITSAPLPPVTMPANQQGVAQGVVKELRDQGFSDNAIGGILYNIRRESNFDPTLRHPDQPRYGGEAHYAHGLFQEGGEEWNTMASHLQDRNWQDPTEQARFVAGRLKGDIGNKQYAEVYRALQAAKTPEDAAKIFARGYLKPAAGPLASRISDISYGIPGIGFYTGE